jgi:hypothetical protein
LIAVDGNEIKEIDVALLKLGDHLPVALYDDYISQPSSFWSNGFLKGLLYHNVHDLIFFDYFHKNSVCFQVYNSKILIENKDIYKINLEILEQPNHFLRYFVDGLFTNRKCIHVPCKKTREIIVHVFSRLGKICRLDDDYIYIEEIENYDILNNVYLDEIIEIKSSESTKGEKVYDLTIPSTLNFALANGLMVRDTATSGYIQRRMIKIAEDIQVKYDGTVRNSSGNIIQFAYGENFLNPVHSMFINGNGVPCNISRIIQKFNQKN